MDVSDFQDRASAVQGTSRKAEFTVADRIFVEGQRRRRMRWDQIAAQLGVSTHRVRCEFDPTYDPTVLVPIEAGPAEAPSLAANAAPWIERMQARGMTGGYFQRVVLALAERSGLHTAAIVEAIGISNNSVFSVLNRLKTAGVITFETVANGRIRKWSLAPLGPDAEDAAS